MAKNVSLMFVAGVFIICLVLAAPTTAAASIRWPRPPPTVRDFCSPGRRTSVLCKPGPSPVITCAVITGSCSPFVRAGAPAAACCNGIRKLKSAGTASGRKDACRCLKFLGSSIVSRCGVRVPYALNAKTDCSRIG